MKLTSISCRLAFFSSNFWIYFCAPSPIWATCLNPTLHRGRHDVHFKYTYFLDPLYKPHPPFWTHGTGVDAFKSLGLFSEMWKLRTFYQPYRTLWVKQQTPVLLNVEPFDTECAFSFVCVHNCAKGCLVTWSRFPFLYILDFFNLGVWWHLK